MNNTPNKSDKASSVTQVSSLTQYIEWVAKISEGNMLFRGLANAEWKVESSLYRRLILSGLKHVGSNIFLEMTKVLIKRASKEGYDIENIPKLNDLELLANLQHYGAATCLIDFTKHSLIALCFACESADSKIGKVVAFDSDDTDLYEEISINSSNEKIEHWLTEYERNKKLFILSPKKRNNRIASQQSVFVFGSPTLPDENFYICEIDTTKKKEILEELKKNGISAEMLFDDFVGFAALNSHNKKYENWDTDSDFISGNLCHESGDFESAIKYYDKTIKSDSKNYKAYTNRGNAKSKLGNFQNAINDYDEAIKLNIKDSLTYYNRGVIKNQLGNFLDALSDYDEAIRLNSKSYATYTNRGMTKISLGNFLDATNDFNEANKLNPKSYETYHGRGVAKIKLGHFLDAISDFNEAIRLNPEDYTVYNNRGFAKRASGDIKGAHADFAKAEELNTEFEVPDLLPDNSDK